MPLKRRWKLGLGLISVYMGLGIIRVHMGCDGDENSLQTCVDYMLTNSRHIFWSFFFQLSSSTNYALIEYNIVTCSLCSVRDYPLPLSQNIPV